MYKHMFKVENKLCITSLQVSLLHKMNHEVTINSSLISHPVIRTCTARVRWTCSPFRPAGSASLLLRLEFPPGGTLSVPGGVRDPPHRGSRSSRSAGSPDASLVSRFVACGIRVDRRSGRQNRGFYSQTRPRRCKTSPRISAEAPGRRSRVGRGKPAGHPPAGPGFPRALPSLSPAASDRERPIK